jgi:hypothetical protein
VGELIPTFCTPEFESIEMGPNASGLQDTTFPQHNISLAVNDGVGGIGIVNKVNSDLPAMEVIYDPNGGFVTSGGWIMTGKANFGFVSKYQKGTTIPTGETEFNFQVGNLNFHSTRLRLAGDFGYAGAIQRYRHDQRGGKFQLHGWRRWLKASVRFQSLYPL